MSPAQGGPSRAVGPSMRGLLTVACTPPSPDLLQRLDVVVVPQTVQEYGLAAAKVWLKTEAAITAGRKGRAADSDEDEAEKETNRRARKWRDVNTRPLAGLTGEQGQQEEGWERW